MCTLKCLLRSGALTTKPSEHYAQRWSHLPVLRWSPNWWNLEILKDSTWYNLEKSGYICRRNFIHTHLYMQELPWCIFRLDQVIVSFLPAGGKTSRFKGGIPLANAVLLGHLGPVLDGIGLIWNMWHARGAKPQNKRNPGLQSNPTKSSVDWEELPREGLLSWNVWIQSLWAAWEHAQNNAWPDQMNSAKVCALLVMMRGMMNNQRCVDLC